MTGPEPNRYTVTTSSDGGAWEVSILDPAGSVVFTRACADGAEAEAFASIVRQHVAWLSEEKFRAYYRLDAREG